MSTEQLAQALRGMLHLDEDHQRGVADEDVCVEVRAARAALAAHEAEKAQAAPTLCRSRCRIKGQNDPWTPWRECSHEAATELERINCPQWEYEVQRLYAAPAAPVADEFTESARAALLWVLWHHQGGSSPIGQPIRFALGMGQHEYLSGQQVADAKRWAAVSPAAHEAEKAQAAPVPVVFVRDIAELLGVTVPDVSAALVALGHHPRSTNMAIGGEEAVSVARHIRAAAQAAPVAAPSSEGARVWSPDERRIGKLLFAAWSKAEPSHGVTLHPESYRATFCDMARAVLAQAAPKAAALAHAVEALEEIALAGMSGTGQESEEALLDWHARRAFQFIGIAARAREKVRDLTSGTAGTEGSQA